MVQRKRLPDERQSIIHKFQVYDQEGYLIVGMYPNGRPGEIFVKIAKEGSTVSGLLDGIAIVISIALRHGVPLDSITTKLKNMHFEPYGETTHPDIKKATSLLDYIVRWLELKFAKEEPHD